MPLSGGAGSAGSAVCAAGRRVYGVRVLTSTLEEVYLDAVGGETS